MIPNEVVYLLVTVYNGTTGAPVTGLVTANFSVDYYLNATTPASAFTSTEIGSGVYRLAVTLPATAGFLNILIAQSTNIVSPMQWSGEIENADFDSIYPLIIRPITQISGTSSLSSEVTLTINAYRYKELSVSIVDQAGAAIDLSGYNNWRFNVWTKTHSGSIYTLNSGITGSAGGVVAWSVPENASFFSFIDAEITASNDSLTLYYDMVADKDANTDRSSTVFRGQLILTRFEGSAS
jgi:hypothetical protein